MLGALSRKDWARQWSAIADHAWSKKRHLANSFLNFQFSLKPNCLYNALLLGTTYVINSRFEYRIYFIFTVGKRAYFYHIFFCYSSIIIFLSVSVSVHILGKIFSYFFSIYTFQNYLPGRCKSALAYNDLCNFNLWH